ncbi:Cytochrome c-type biogenesis protein DsbD, protein-disulfide reductase [hydrothermal vent metagenome]|uniref:Cytochrome c-type biogenesis protein DsbD, protein-disulfide reductase n=1 Tax=hydrothermal vent metagenome TaxID=652676 RepID=A0A1W1CTJ4_9ZZZZ
MPNFIKKLLLVSLLFSAWGFGDFSSMMKREKFLTPQEAFHVSAIVKEGMIQTTLKMADKIHIYEDTLHYRIVAPKRVQLHVQKPKPHEVNGEKVYEKELRVNIPISKIVSEVAGDYTLEVEFQGCSDTGICYQPIRKTFHFKGVGELGFFDKISSLAKSGNTQNIADALANESWVFILLLFFVAGVLMSLTPCILPMVPILSSIIIQQTNTQEKSKKSQAFMISLVYVVSMALAYAMIGVVAGLFDFDLQANMNNPWVLVPVAGIFAILAFSMFGYYEIALPVSWQSKLNTLSSHHAQGKGLIGTVIMGAISALIVGACTAPVISGAILFIILTGKALLGGISLFVMGIGMGIPLLLVGAGASSFVPKPGGWMNRVSKFFGLLMLVMALVILARVIPHNEGGDRGYSLTKLKHEVEASSKPVVIDIYKAGCAACKELEEITFSDKKVKEELRHFTFIHIDVTDYTEEEKVLLRKYKLFGAPNIIFFDKNNQYLPSKNLTGFISPEVFVKHLKSIDR